MQRLATILFLLVFGILTFIGRWFLEPLLGIGPLGSLLIGAGCVGFVYLLFKGGVLSLARKSTR